MSREATCTEETCGADIMFVPHITSGKTMVLNAEPEAGGAWHLQTSLDGEVRAYHCPDGRGRMPHHATCTNPERFRR